MHQATEAKREFVIGWRQTHSMESQNIDNGYDDDNDEDGVLFVFCMCLCNVGATEY